MEHPCVDVTFDEAVDHCAISLKAPLCTADLRSRNLEIFQSNTSRLFSSTRPFHPLIMADYDSDSSLEDASEYTETGVLLGYATKEPTDDSVSHLGGEPVSSI